MGFLCALLAISGIQLGPNLAELCSPRLYELNMRVQRELAAGDFAAAKASLAEWPFGEVTYEIVGDLPVNGKSADVEAAKIWQDATGGKIRFVKGKNPRVRIEMVDVVQSIDPLPELVNGVVVGKVAKTFGYNGAANVHRSIVFAISKAFGMGIGMEPSNYRTSLLGIDPHNEGYDDLPIVPDAEDKKIIAALVQAHEDLTKYVSTKTKIEPAVPALTISPDGADAGDILQGVHAAFSFSLTNKGNAPLSIYIEKSCGCVVLSNPDPIPPGGKFVLDPEVMTEEMNGPLTKTLILHTNDPAAPVRLINMKLNVRPELRILPDGFKRVELPDEGGGSYEFMVYAMPGKKLSKLEAVCTHIGAKVAATPFKAELITDAVMGAEPQKHDGYKVKVTFTDEFPPGTEWVRILLLTDLEKTPRREVALNVQKGLSAQPEAVYFGTITLKQPQVRTVLLEHASKSFQVLEATATAGLSVKVVDESGSGRRYKVVVTAPADKLGQFRGQVNIKTTNAKYPIVIIPVSGEVAGSQ